MTFVRLNQAIEDFYAIQNKTQEVGIQSPKALNVFSLCAYAHCIAGRIRPDLVPATWQQWELIASDPSAKAKLDEVAQELTEATKKVLKLIVAYGGNSKHMEESLSNVIAANMKRIRARNSVRKLEYQQIEINVEDLENRADTPIVHLVVKRGDGRKAHIHLSVGLNKRDQVMARVSSACDNPVSKKICAHWAKYDVIPLR